jgi:hypothetical protein
MGRRNKKDKQREQAEDETPEQPVEEVVSPEQSAEETGAPEPVASEEELPQELQDTPAPDPLEEELTDLADLEESAEEEGEEPVLDEPEEEEAHEPKDRSDAEPKGFIGTYWMLMLGVLLATMGVAAVIMLRTNFIQVYIMGVDNPSAGIGSQEAMAYAGSMIPFAIGLFAINYWGKHTVIPDGDALAEGADSEIEVEEQVSEPIAVEETHAAPDIVESKEQPEEFGHKHLPPAHLTTVQKIKHLTMAYSQGKISEGLYNNNMAKFEAELEARPEKVDAPAAEFGHEHLPPVHLSPDEKIDHLTRAYAQGKISKGLYERDLAKFEEELKKEQLHMPPHHLGSQEKIDHLEDAYRMGRISKGTYEKNIGRFREDLVAEQARKAAEEPPEVDVPRPKPKMDAEIPDSTSNDDDKTLMQLDSLLEEIESGNDTVDMREKLRKKKEESFEERILKEIEDLEDL